MVSVEVLVRGKHIELVISVHFLPSSPFPLLGNCDYQEENTCKKFVWSVSYFVPYFEHTICCVDLAINHVHLSPACGDNHMVTFYI